jgi:hypothetical protein
MFTKVKKFVRGRGTHGNAGMEGTRATRKYRNGSSDSDLRTKKWNTHGGNMARMPRI